MMTDSRVEMYKTFRNELDTLCVPNILKDEKMKVTDILWGNKKVGIMCVYDDLYIDCIYVKPEYRRRGLATKAAVSFVLEKGGQGVRLSIINNNIAALAFWNSLFKLWRIDGNNIDTLYEIVKVKPDIERDFTKRIIKEGMILQSRGGNEDGLFGS